MVPSTEEALIRLVWALLLGGLIGFEREYTQKSAGLRTHILVCMGSAVFTLISVSDWLYQDPSVSLGRAVPHFQHGVNYTYQLSHDPGRIIAQIVTGIGFIGGGALLHYGSSVRGVTTAASLWITASIGMLAGTGAYRFSFLATVLTFLVLFSLGKIEHALFRKERRTFRRLSLWVQVEPDALDITRQWIQQTFQGNILSLTESLPSEAAIATVYQMLHAEIDVADHLPDWQDLRDKLEDRQGVLSTGFKFH
jgi:uncharacterized membrane protein YhiD involved in acid resistance